MFRGHSTCALRTYARLPTCFRAFLAFVPLLGLAAALVAPTSALAVPCTAYATTASVITASSVVGVPCTVYVNYLATGGTNSGASWTNAYTDLQSALDDSFTTGDAICVAEGTYKPGTTQSAVFALPAGVFVFGGCAGTETDSDERPQAGPANPAAASLYPTILSGEIGNQSITTDNSTVIAQCNVTGSGQDFYLDRFTMTAGNRSMDVGDCSFSMKDCRIVDSGGLSLSNSVEVDLDGCMFEGDVVALNSSNVLSLMAQNCQFLYYESSSFGVAVMLYTGSDSYVATFKGCLFADNEATGAYLLASSGATLQATFHNCTFYDNSSSNLPIAGIRCSGASATCTIKNSILWDNDGSGGGTPGYADQVGGTATFTIEHSDILGQTDTSNGNINQNPVFDTGSGRIGRITAASTACRDSGDNSVATWGHDLDHYFRIANTTVDMGVNEIKCKFGDCRCDLDVNGFVAVPDRAYVSANIGCTLGGYCTGCDKYDLDNNYVVNPADRSIISANLGECGVVVGPTACPDP